jgi:hypothetical protein
MIQQDSRTIMGGAIVGIRSIAAAVVVTIVGLAPALAQNPAGEAVAVTPSAAAAGGAGSRTLAVNGPVFMGDLVTTDADGLAQLKFRDDTRMVVGPNSELTIDRFVFAGEATAKQVTLNATRGVFRFITGNSPKSAYLIDTPIATIGTRGSHADIIVGENAVSLVYYSERGTIADEHGLYVCDKPQFRATDRNRRHCVELTKGCTFVTFARGQDPVFERDAYARAQKMDAIGFAFNRGITGEDFRVNSGRCNSREALLPRRNAGEDSVTIEEGRTPRQNPDEEGDGEGDCDGECNVPEG